MKATTATEIGKSPPSISVVMPSFNQAAYVREAIESVVAQRYPRLELIVLDGGSTDGSWQIIQEYASHIAFSRSGHDGGQTEALIEGISMANGRLVGWLNTDDVLLPGCLWKIAAAYRNFPDRYLFGGNFLFIDARGTVVRCKRHPRAAAAWARAGVMAVNQPGSFFTRDAYERVGGLRHELEYVMDSEFYVRLLAQSGNKYAHVSDWLAAFRLHAEQKTARIQLRDAEHRYCVTSQAAGFRRLGGARVWQLLFRANQTVNGNYLRMAAETVRAKGQSWQDWAAKHCRSVVPDIGEVSSSALTTV